MSSPKSDKWLNRVACVSLLSILSLSSIRGSQQQVEENHLPRFDKHPSIIDQDFNVTRWVVGDAHAVENQKDRPGNKYLFFKHIRKAGGTSMRNYLQTVHEYHAASLNWTYYEQEFNGMHWDCPRVDKDRWENSVRVIILRQPIERHLSEYFYSGLPHETNETIQNQLHQMHSSRNYTPQFYHLLSQQMVPWMEHGMTRVRRSGKFYRYFSDELQVRALSGETKQLPHNQTPDICASHPGRIICNHWDSPCAYGGGWIHGGTRVSHEVNEVALQRAKTNLKMFELILLTETLNNPDQVEYASAVLDVPTSYVSLSSKQEKVVDPYGKSAMLEGMKENAPELLALLEQRSEKEIELYEYAKQLNQERVLRWSMLSKQAQVDIL